MRTSYCLSFAAAAGALVAAGLNAPTAALAAPRAVMSAAAHTAPGAHHDAAPKRAGRATGARRAVNLRHLVSSLPARKAASAGRLMAPHADLITPTGADVTSQFDGIAGPVGPPDPSSATNGSQIVEIANGFLQVTDNNGAVQCGGGITVDHLLRTSDLLLQPQVVYDNFQGRFIVTASVAGIRSDPAPAMWVATSNSSNPCQTWNVYRLVFSGGPFASGAVLIPRVGQDRRAVLIGANVNNAPAPTAYTVFAISKSDLYAGNPVSFPAFTVGSQAVPASNAGEPMIDSQFSYFLGADPQIGYQLYRMTGSGTANPDVSLVATLGQPYTPPARALQPPSDPGPSTGDGRITVSPAYDGSRIWFAHGIQFPDSPATVRYGYIDLASNFEFDRLITVDAPFSYEFNGSIGVGFNADGTEAIFLNWAYTDPHNSVQVSDAVDAFVWNGGFLGYLPALQGQQTLVTGGPSGNDLFGSYSSVAVEPTTSGATSCAVTTQEYFGNSGWNTRLARVCSPTTIGVPDVGTTTVAQATSILASYGLSVGAQTITTNCDPTTEDGQVVGTTPGFDQPVPLGGTVGLILCRRVVPNVIGETTANATSAVQAAGLLVGTITSEFNCTPAAAGTVTATNPAAGTALPYQSFITLTECVPPPPSGIVPDVTGDTREQAAQQLDAAGFVLGAVHTLVDDSCGFIGLVMSQSPAAGTQASPGSAVSITLGRAPKFCSP